MAGHRWLAKWLAKFAWSGVNRAIVQRAALQLEIRNRGPLQPLLAFQDAVLWPIDAQTPLLWLCEKLDHWVWGAVVGNMGCLLQWLRRWKGGVETDARLRNFLAEHQFMHRETGFAITVGQRGWGPPDRFDDIRNNVPFARRDFRILEEHPSGCLLSVDPDYGPEFSFSTYQILSDEINLDSTPWGPSGQYWDH